MGSFSPFGPIRFRDREFLSTIEQTSVGDEILTCDKRSLVEAGDTANLNAQGLAMELIDDDGVRRMLDESRRTTLALW